MNGRALRWGLVASGLAIAVFLPPPALAQTCEACGSTYNSCLSYCDTQTQDCWNGGGWNCDQQRNDCYVSCDNEQSACLGSCDPGGGGGGGGPVTYDHGHVWCDGWENPQHDCAFNHIGVAAGAEFRRLRGGGGYIGQTFLTWQPAEFNGFGRFTVPDGNVGIISTVQEPGQVPLHRWSTRRGFYYSIYYTQHASDYVYGGIAGYVWPLYLNVGFPLYQFYSHEYGHFYTNHPSDIRCQPPANWAFQGEMARVNWPAPFSSIRTCFNNGGLFIPPNCAPFAAETCRATGRLWNPANCTCS